MLSIWTSSKFCCLVTFVVCRCFQPKVVGIFVHVIQKQVNSLPYYRILASSNFKEFAGDKIQVAQMMKFVLDGLENIMGKEENGAYKHFFFFPLCFQKPSFTGSLIIVRITVKPLSQIRRLSA